MNLLRILLSIFPAVLLAVVSSPSPAGAQCGDHPEVIGAWEWQGTWGPQTFPSFTPESTGKTMQIEILESGLLRQYENEELLWEASWSFADCEHDGEIGYYWGFDTDGIRYHPGDCAPYYVTVSGGEMAIGDLHCLDTPFSLYTAREPVAVSETTWGGIKRLYK